MEPPDEERRRLDDPNRRRSLLGFLVAAQQLENFPSLDGVAVDQMSFDRRRRALTHHEAAMIRQVTAEGMPGCLRRFNAAVENHRGLHQIKFRCRCFRGLEADHEELRRLFFTVLPNHPTLRWFSIDADSPASLLKLLAEGITATTTTTRVPATAPPIELEIVGGLDHHRRPVPLKDVARMVQRNAPLGRLFLCRNHWAAADVQLLCDALPTNQHLRALELRGFRIEGLHPATLRGAWGRASPLRQLYCPHPPTDMPVNAFLDMIRALRANETLEVIAWPCPGPSLQYCADRVDEVCQLLRHHNYTLRRIEGFDRHPSVATLLSANATVRDAHQALQRTEYRVARLAMWPRAMHRISSKPSLLYKFLRHGNCDHLARHLKAASKPHAPPMARKRRHDEEESPAGEIRLPRGSRPSFWRWA